MKTTVRFSQTFHISREIAQALGKTPALTSIVVYSTDMELIVNWIRDGHIGAIGQNPSLQEIIYRCVGAISYQEVEEASKAVRLPERVVKLIKLNVHISSSM